MLMLSDMFGGMNMANKKKQKGIEQIKSRNGFLFVLPWLIGFVTFFALPVIKSIWFSFCNVTMSVSGVSTEFIGIDRYKHYLLEDAEFTDNLLADIGSLVYSLPIILLLSLVLAILLNQKFRGRLFFRALYFMPVIIASGVVIELLFKTTDEELLSSGVSVALSDSMFSVEDVVELLSLPDNVAVYVKNIINNIFDLLWSCGIQTVLFIAGLQSIPRTLYEASKVEGCTKWEEFWYITFPMLGSVTLLVSVFTMVDQFTNTRRLIIETVYRQMSSGVYDSTSTMLWIYFLLVGIVMGLFLLLYNRCLLRRWQ